MDYYSNKSKTPYYNIYNSKIEMNKSNNNNNNIKSFYKEIQSKKNRTSKNTPKKLIYKDNSKDFGNTKNNPLNELRRNDNQMANNELNNNNYIKKMKKINSYNQSLQNISTNRHNSYSLLSINGNRTSYKYKQIIDNTTDKTNDLSMNHSKLVKINYNNNSINNNNFSYNNNLFNYYKNSLKVKESKNKYNNLYLYKNNNKGGLNQFSKNHLNSSNSMKELLPKKINSNLENENYFYYNINNNKSNLNENNVNDNLLIKDNNNIKNKINLYNKINNNDKSDLMKNGGNLLIKTYLNQKNCYKNNFNNRSANEIIVNKNDLSEIQNNNSMTKLSSMNVLFNKLKSKKDFQKNIIKCDNNNNENRNNSRIDLINNKKNNLIEYEMSGLNPELSRINRTTFLNSKNSGFNEKKVNLYQDINNNNHLLNNSSRSIEEYMNINQKDVLKNNSNKSEINNFHKLYLYKALKLSEKSAAKKDIQNNNMKNNNSNTLKLKRDISAYLNISLKKQINGNSAKSFYNVEQIKEKLSNLNSFNSRKIKNIREIKNAKKIFRNENKVHLNDNKTNNMSNNNNLSNVNSFSISQYKNFNTMNSKNNSTANNFLTKEAKLKNSFKNSGNNSPSNNISINRASVNDNSIGKDNPKDFNYKGEIKTNAPIINYYNQNNLERKEFFTNFDNNEHHEKNTSNELNILKNNNLINKNNNLSNDVNNKKFLENKSNNNESNYINIIDNIKGEISNNFLNINDNSKSVKNISEYFYGNFSPVNENIIKPKIEKKEENEIVCVNTNEKKILKVEERDKKSEQNENINKKEKKDSFSLLDKDANILPKSSPMVQNNDDNKLNDKNKMKQKEIKEKDVIVAHNKNDLNVDKEIANEEKEKKEKGIKTGVKNCGTKKSEEEKPKENIKKEESNKSENINNKNNELNNLQEGNNNQNETSPKNNDNSLKNKREVYKINEKTSSKVRQYDLIKNMYKQDMLCEPINVKKQKKNMDELSQNNSIIMSTSTKDCDYYKNEQEKLAKFITNYFKKNKKYPKSDLSFYLYGRQLGHGAFGKVNIALHIGSGRLVAIKNFAKKNLKNTRAKQKIKNEIQMLSRFHHPFINQILDYFETDTYIFIVMEYVCGDLLDFIRKRGKLSEPISKIIFKQLIEGLKYIHKKNVVHRDIKLDNILIDLTNTIKICDFGVSRQFEDNELMYEHCGTPAYISPEIFENKGYKGTGCDIWSAGVTLYYMLGGVQPFKANSIRELERNIKKGHFKPLEEVSQEANDLIKGMLQVNPRKRFVIEDILRHPWLDKVELNQRHKLNLFTDAEKILMSKFDVNYLYSDKNELIENFTIKNLEEDKKDTSKSGNTKSLIFAPYNSYIDNENASNMKSYLEEQAIYKELEIMNDVCKFGRRAHQEKIQYELLNNEDFDNGMMITQKEEDINQKNEKIEKLLVNDNSNKIEKKRGSNTSRENHDFFDDIDNNIKINKKILVEIEKNLGYDKNYVIDCIKNNKVNYATGTYYLMSKETQIFNE